MFEHKLKTASCVSQLSFILQCVFEIPNYDSFSIEKKEPLNKEILEKFMEIINNISIDSSVDTAVDKFEYTSGSMYPNNIQEILNLSVINLERNMLKLYNKDAGLFMILYYAFLRILNKADTMHYIVGSTLGLPSISSKIREMIDLETKPSEEAIKIYTKNDLYRILINPNITDESDRELREVVENNLHASLMNNIYDLIHEYPDFVCIADTIEENKLGFINNKMRFITDLLFTDPNTSLIAKPFVDINKDVESINESFRISMICESGFDELMNRMDTVVDEAVDTNIFKIAIDEYLVREKDLLERIKKGDTLIGDSAPYYDDMSGHITKFTLGFYDKLVKILYEKKATTYSNIHDVFGMVIHQLSSNPIMTYGAYKSNSRNVINALITLLLNSTTPYHPSVIEDCLQDRRLSCINTNECAENHHYNAYGESIMVAVYAIAVDYLMEYIDLFVDIFNNKPSLLFSTCLKYEQTLVQ